MLQRCVVFEQILAGPSRSRADALDALRAAGFDAREAGSPHGPQDSDTWVVAERAMRSEPTGQDQAALMDRAAEAADRYGYALRMHAVVWAARDLDGGA